MQVERTQIEESEIGKFKNENVLLPDKYMTRFASAKH
jgi:hypothetical protein